MKKFNLLSFLSMHAIASSPMENIYQALKVEPSLKASDEGYKVWVKEAGGLTCTNRMEVASQITTFDCSLPVPSKIDPEILYKKLNVRELYYPSPSNNSWALKKIEWIEWIECNKQRAWSNNIRLPFKTSYDCRFE